MLTAWAVTFGLLLAVAFALKITGFYSRIWSVNWFFATAVLLTFGRLVVGPWVRPFARDGRFTKRTVIIGAGLARPGGPVADYSGEKSDLYALTLDDMFSFDFGKIQNQY